MSSKRAYKASQIASIVGINVKNVRGKLKKHKCKAVNETGIGGTYNKYLFHSLPREWQTAIDLAEAKAEGEKLGIPPVKPCDPQDLEVFAAMYCEAPDYNKRKADKYLNILMQCGTLSGRELMTWIEGWNRENPEMKTSYPAVMAARQKEKVCGKTAFIGEYGNRRGTSTVADDAYEYFKCLYLDENAKGGDSCWRVVAGKFGTKGEIADFPSTDAFMRKLKNELSPSVIYFHRKGFKMWNKKYGYYIKRDYSQCRAGECWVSDHCQVDIGVIDAKTGKPVFAWLTSWQDFKTGRIVSRFYHVEAPNQDHVPQSFYMAAIIHGLPDYIYIDNGKDYKAKSVAGGKYLHRLTVDEAKVRSLTGALNIIPIFAIPYNAQAKIIERYHRCIKEDFSMFCVGYRGGNVTERPERLARDIKAGALMPFAQAEEHLTDWIFNVYNKSPSYGRLEGKSPEDAWNLENPVKKAVTRDALKLFCMRSSGDMTIGRNGIEDRALGVTYFAEWMVPMVRRKVFLRRDITDYNDAWVFDAETGEYLNSARIAGLSPALAKDEIGQEQVKEACQIKNRAVKAIKALGKKTMKAPDTAEILANQKAFIEKSHTAVAPQEQNQLRVENNYAEQVARSRKREESVGKADTELYSLGRALANAREMLEIAEKRIIRLESDRPAKQAEIALWKTKVAELEKELSASKGKKVKAIKGECHNAEAKEPSIAVNQ